MQKKLIIVLILLIAAGIAAWYYLRPTRSGDELVLYGNVDIRQVSLAFEGSERVVDMLAEEGDRVSAGQVVARLDTRTLRLQIEQAQAQIAVQEQALLRLHNGSRPEEILQAKAQVASAQADVDLAAVQLKRLQNIAAETAGQAVSQQDIDNAQAKLQVTRAQLQNQREALQLAEIGPRQEDIGEAEAQLQVSRAELALLRHYVDQAELKAPVDGVVRSRLLQPGDMASPQRPVYALAINDPKWIRAYVNEPQLGLIRPGMAAEVVTDSHPDQPISGHIGYISSVAEFTPKPVQTEELRTSLVYEVRVLVEDPDDRLRLGMPATVRLTPANGDGPANPSIDRSANGSAK